MLLSSLHVLVESTLVRKWQIANAVLSTFTGDNAIRNNSMPKQFFGMHKIGVMDSHTQVEGERVDGKYIVLFSQCIKIKFKVKEKMVYLLLLLLFNESLMLRYCRHNNLLQSIFL